MTLCYPNRIRISSVKRRKVDADFSGRAISGYKIKSSSDRMNGVATVNTPATGAPMITGMSTLPPPPAPCCERRPALATSRSSALAKAAGTLLAFAALHAPLPAAAQNSITLISNTGEASTEGRISSPCGSGSGVHHWRRRLHADQS